MALLRLYAEHLRISMYAHVSINIRYLNDNFDSIATIKCLQMLYNSQVLSHHPFNYKLSDFYTYPYKRQ